MATEQEVKQESKQESKTKRTFVNISTSTTTTGRIIVFALCNEGNIWYRDILDDQQSWTKVKGL